MFSIPRGASQSFTISNVVDEAGALIDLSSWRLYATVRVHEVVVIEKKSANVGGGSTDQIETLAPGSFRVKFTQADTTREPTAGTIDVFAVKDAVAVQLLQQPFEITQAQTRTFPT